MKIPQDLNVVRENQKKTVQKKNKQFNLTKKSGTFTYSIVIQVKNEIQNKAEMKRRKVDWPILKNMRKSRIFVPEKINFSLEETQTLDP